MKKRSFVMGIALVLIMSINAFASTNITKEYKYDSTFGEYEKANYMDKEFNSGANKYKAKSVTYKIEKYIDSPENVIKNYSSLNEKKVAKDIKENGFSYELKSTDYKENKGTHTETFINADQIPNTFDVKLNDGKIAIGTLSENKESMSNTLDRTLSLPAIFYGDSDVAYYLYNGIRVPSSSAPAFDNYQSIVLNSLGLNSNDYTINSAQWTSDYYSLNGQTVRNAVFTGLQRSKINEVTYEYTTYDAKAIYKLNDKKAKVKAVAIVEFEKAGLSTTTKIVIAVGLLILALAIVLILMVLAKKRKKKNTESV